MPRSTVQYPFEWKIFRWVQGFSNRMKGECHYAFGMAFDDDGRCMKILFGDRPEMMPQEIEALTKNARSWILYDPFDGPAYAFLKWQNVNRQTMERIIETGFEQGDFSGAEEARDFPHSWSVMF